jgi:hypothetical protein
MAKKKLTTFSDLARTKKPDDNVNVNDNIDINDNENNNVNDDVNININDNVNAESDFVGSLKSLADKSKKKGKDNMKPTGIYFEKNVLSVLKELATNGGRGAQSKIVNDATKEAFIQAGLLDKDGNIIK